MRPREAGEKQPGIGGQPRLQRVRSATPSASAAAFPGCRLLTPLVKFVAGVGFTPAAAWGAHGVPQPLLSC